MMYQGPLYPHSSMQSGHLQLGRQRDIKILLLLQARSVILCVAECNELCNVL